MSYFRCTVGCAVESGYECGGGSPVQRDTCYEKCGDGIDGGSYSCDDGNNIGGDGCSSTC